MPFKPFKRIATAITFSDKMEARINESLRIRDMIGEKLFLIHIGQKTASYEARLEEVLKKAGEDSSKLEIVFEDGDPVNAILKVCREKKIDLVIAGAQPREGLLKYYIGSVARRLVRSSDCSILLMTRPSKLKNTCGRIVVKHNDHPKSDYTIKTALQVAIDFGSDKLIIAEEGPQEPSESRGQKIMDKLKGIPVAGKPEVSVKPVGSKKGYGISNFTQTQQADLLVLNSPDTKLGFLDRVFTHDLEYVLSELPSDLLIVHSTSR